MDDHTPIRDPLSDRWEGLVFTNPVSGERIEVLEVRQGPERPGLKGRLTVAPGGIGPPRHVHPAQQEDFAVEEGRLTVHRDDDTLELSRGESLTVPAGTAHGFENRTGAPAVFTGAIHPPGRLLHALAMLSGLARDGRTRDDGSPRNFLQAMVFAQAMREVMHLASPPRPVQQAMWTVFAPIGRMFGHQPVDDRYLSPDFWEWSDGETTD